MTGQDDGRAKRKTGQIAGRRQQNKRNMKKMMQSTRKWCQTYFRSGTCPYNDSCKLSHDMEAFIKERPQDLDLPCYMFETTKVCPFGLLCRTGRDHVTIQDGVGTSTGQSTKLLPGLINHDIRTQVRKKTYSFPKSDAVLEEYAIYNSKSPNYHGLFNSPQNDDTSSFFKDHIKGKRVLAPLTTVGNLPFRRICVELGAQVTCGEMVLSDSLLGCYTGEWALTKRHESEKTFGIQIAGSHVDTLCKAVELVSNHCSMDFIDLNMSCPIDLVCNKGQGAALLLPNKAKRAEELLRAMSRVSPVPVSTKLRKGFFEEKVAKDRLEMFHACGLSFASLHGRSRKQRYTKKADWNYIQECATHATSIGLGFIGNGDCYTFEQYNERMDTAGTVMIARGALVKPWIFKEIEEQRHWDIRSSERLALLRSFANYGMEHWGSDTRGIEQTRRFMLEWISFLYRYIPVGLLDQSMHATVQLTRQPDTYVGRDELETLMMSPASSDWVKISEMLLGPVPDGFSFTPKHKANAFADPVQPDLSTYS